MAKNIVIWGAGKIGRASVGEIFHKNGYHLDFIARNKAFADEMNKRGKYSVIRTFQGNRETIRVDDFCTYHTSMQGEIEKLLDDTQIIAISTFPESYADVAPFIAGSIKRRRAGGDHTPFNLLMCANGLGLSAMFADLLSGHLDEDEMAFARDTMGICDTILIRWALAPDEQTMKADPLAIIIDNHPDIMVDRDGWKGEIPVLEDITFMENMDAQQVRKLYTNNLAHVAAAYFGGKKGYKDTAPAMADEQVAFLIRRVLEEASAGLVAEYGFDPEDQKAFAERAFAKFSNGDMDAPLGRAGNGVLNKVKRDERIIGPALLCRKHGIYPYYLAKLAAYALTFDNPEDETLGTVAGVFQAKEAKAAIAELCGLENEPDLSYMIARHYEADGGTFQPEDAGRVEKLKQAFHNGYINERTYKGCAQCMLMSMGGLNDNLDKKLFQAASGFSGGMAITGDGACGGYSGGIMYTGSYRGRRYDEMKENGDKDWQTQSYEMAQALHDRFTDCYGSVTCLEIHKQVFSGDSYCLRTAEVREKFEEAGAHVDKCTVVVANACVWTEEILLDRKLV